MALTVGICRVELRLPENHSLKGKRQVLKSLIARLHNRFNVSAAEVDEHDSWQIAAVGISVISNNDRHVDEVMANIVSFIRHERLDAEILDVQTEVIRGIED
jgi:uncharacterized protein YlxP (DUF503 family)